jgi:hypothetical protein
VEIRGKPGIILNVCLVDSLQHRIQNDHRCIGKAQKETANNGQFENDSAWIGG